ncbi:endonuclease/exonuclease/phosphatase family protein [bacterium]|nr:endonuclease/exonuclease/phosphatase family protein [bacterium]
MWRNWAVRLAATYFLAILVLTAVVWLAADEWWPATLFAFGPRWLAVLPLTILIPLAIAARSVRAGVLLLVAVVAAAGPLLGGRIAVPTFGRGTDEGYALRVMSWNTAGAAPGNSAFQRYVATVRPDLILLQESAVLAAADIPPGWSVVGDRGGVVTLSRMPAEPAGRLTEADLGAPGGCARSLVQTPIGPVVVVNVHLPTPRPGIEAVLHHRLGGVAALKDITKIRSRALTVVAEWVGPPTDGAVVGGDFNTPVESVVFRRDWGGYGNAFSAAGIGWGGTKLTGWHAIRIDHILYAPPWACRWVAIGTPMGSDHRPVVADIVYGAH